MLNPRFFAPGTGTSAMMDGELKKTSVRANRLEKKRFEMMLSNYDSAKKNLVLEMKRSQVDIKKQLKRYKDRQREILSTKLEATPSSPDEAMLKQFRRLSHTTSGFRRRPTLSSSSLPFSFHAIAQDNVTDAGTSDLGTSDRDTSTIITAASGCGCGGGGGGGSTLDSVTLPLQDDTKDLTSQYASLLHQQQKHNIDLRPYIPVALAHDLCLDDPLYALQLGGGRQGTTLRHFRYFDDEEIEQRRSFHRLLLDKYRSWESQKLDKINDMVGEFCGKRTAAGPSRFVASCPPLVEGGMTSLPAARGPASVHRALRVKIRY